MAKFLPGILLFLLSFQLAFAQVPNRMEQSCLGRTENVYQWLDQGMPLLVFSMDYHCQKEDLGTDLARLAGLHRDDFRVWVRGSFEGVSNRDVHCDLFSQYLGVTTLDRAPAFAFIDSEQGPFYDPNARTEKAGTFTVVGVDRSILYEGDDLEAAKEAALAGKTAEENDQLSPNNIASYPTMTSGMIKIDLPENTNMAEALIYSSNGQLMLRAPHSELDLSGLKNGIYFLHLIDRNGETRYTSKHLLQK